MMRVWQGTEWHVDLTHETLYLDGPLSAAKLAELVDGTETYPIPRESLDLADNDAVLARVGELVRERCNLDASRGSLACDNASTLDADVFVIPFLQLAHCTLYTTPVLPEPPADTVPYPVDSPD